MDSFRPFAVGVATICVVLVVVALAFRYGLLPPEVYGALLGALLTLLGVHSKARYDAEAKRAELAHTLRRDVYLEVAESLARSVHSLLAIARTDAAEGTEPQTETWLQKLELVGSTNTVTFAREVAKLQAATALDLMKRRDKMAKLEFDLKLVREHRERLFRLQRETSDEFAQAAAEKNPDLQLARFKILEERRVRLQEAVEASQADDDAKTASRDREHRELAKAAIRGSAVCIDKATKLQNAIRREMALVGEIAEEIPVGEPLVSEDQLDDYVKYLDELWPPRDDAR